MSTWTGFYKKSREERLAILQKEELLSPERLNQLATNQQLPLEVADQMVENLLGTLSLPLALVPDVLIDGKVYQVPFATEEPSVVAAASFASKIVKRSGGFTTTVHKRHMIGQVALYDVPDLLAAQTAIIDQTDQLLELANAAHPSIVKRGGGARTLRVEVVENTTPLLVVYLEVDPQEAMGANMVNTMCEALAPVLEELTQGKRLMAILSNYATESLVTATCAIDLRLLSRNTAEGLDLAEKIALASQFAQADPYRASTHNKGIFNGIDAVVLATGNDWRAIEAGGHAYASRDGQYRGLARWSLSEDKAQLLGQLTLPMPIATKGGSIGLNPSVQVAHDLLGQPTAKELARVIVAIGLAQNLAALKALTSTGIQAGHMKLHAKSLALLAGASSAETDRVVKELLSAQHMNLETATAILQNIRQEN
ncbi:hydroxymethylglutaryl-CoA reductase, degradative [Streptococcus entericus]|uniref:hydroxymethylglutaryl-CoA reductase, degradative n=1 Tax=Streptococcus entericus TaxID=155680 RepID=UPI00037F42BB|nr:hydroxymethylglutaryl-CoA reductase, degradative [Streptococcus entericus]